MQIDQLPPQAIEIEQSLLASCLHGDADEVAEVVRVSDFCRAGHQTIYRAVLDLLKEKAPVDLLTLTDALRPLC